MWSVNLPLAIGATATSRVLDYGRGHVRRLSVIETTGTTPATVYLWDGSGANGQLLDTISLAAGQSTRDYYRIGEYPFDNGLYLQVVAGSVVGAIVVAHHDQGEAVGEPVVIIGQLDLNISAPVGG